MTSTGPRRLQIASGLKKLRQRSDLTLEEVAKRAGYGKTTVGRYEDWTSKTMPKPRAVRLIAEAAGGTDAEIAALVRLAEDMPEGWWVGAGVPEWLHPLVSLENEAMQEGAFAPSVVPGLLQTAEYARAIHLAEMVRQPLDVVEALVAARMQRQAVLDRDIPLHLWVVLDQAVLRREVGDRTVMAAQLDHLMEQAKRPNIDIQVLPFKAGAHAAGFGHFITLGAGDSTDAVYVEMLGGGLYIDAKEDVRRYTVAMDYLRSQAVDTTESMNILAAERKEYDK
ncbi:helix-turn-helix transcriptional regulator [Streptomyces sp. CB03238]|uniref:helix-turn-helix domain-containing protein n=1 Tax=Streptomyces sp. CB03238 TaxID=1907777 RepID=UPI000A110344|nr:helix-turn-helix transcriptional regulator [Streptomyces sp. CB03238]ORT54210.1 DNA-binding protein [Streptomyces sp. CB03238]